jgi:hypothetical protein
MLLLPPSLTMLWMCGAGACALVPGGYRGLRPDAYLNGTAAGGRGQLFFAMSQGDINVLFSGVALCEITSQQITCN